MTFDGDVVLSAENDHLNQPVYKKPRLGFQDSLDTSVMQILQTRPEGGWGEGGVAKAEAIDKIEEALVIINGVSGSSGSAEGTCSSKSVTQLLNTFWIKEGMYICFSYR